MNVDARFRYVSLVTYPEFSSLPVEDYFVVDLALSKKLSHNLFAKVSALNLLDARHYEYPQYTELTRKVLASIRFEF